MHQCSKQAINKWMSNIMISGWLVYGCKPGHCLVYARIASVEEMMISISIDLDRVNEPWRITELAAFQHQVM